MPTSYNICQLPASLSQASIIELIKKKEVEYMMLGYKLYCYGYPCSFYIKNQLRFPHSIKTGRNLRIVPYH